MLKKRKGKEFVRLCGPHMPPTMNLSVHRPPKTPLQLERVQLYPFIRLLEFVIFGKGVLDVLSTSLNDLVY